MKTIASFLLGSTLALLMSCSGGTESSSQPQESQTQPTQEEAQPPAELTQNIENGKTIYNQYCLVCHQSDGNGVTGAFPTLHQTEWVQGDKTKLIGVVLNGLQGAIEVKGEQYNNAMPQHSFLTDQQVADVLTFVRKSFGNDAPEITPEEVKEVRGQASSGSNKN